MHYSRQSNKNSYKTRTEYLRKVRKLAKSTVYARNLFMGINQWALGVGMVQGIVIRIEEIYNYLKRR